MTNATGKSSSPVPPASAPASAQAQDPAKKSTSPVPPTGAGPTPLLIGKSFIKQYYQVLSTNPEHITKFYKPNSIISHSLLPSVPAEPKTLASDQFFKWAHSEGGEDESENGNTNGSNSGGGLCFDFGKGAIDAQETIQGGILLVVTGQMKLAHPTSTFKPFVHTFFLNNGAPPGKKRQFYVHNDILRFLSTSTEDDTDGQSGVTDSVGVSGEVIAGSTSSTTVPSSTSPVPTPDLEGDVPHKKQEEVSSATSTVATTVSTTTVEKKDEPATVEVPSEQQQRDEASGAPQDQPIDAAATPIAEAGEGSSLPVVTSDEKKKDVKAKKEDKKDTKAAPIEGSSNKASKASSSEKSMKGAHDKKKDDVSSGKASDSGNAPPTKEEKKSRKNKSRGRSRKSRSSSPTEKPDKKGGKSKPKTPGSWASLVAGGSASSSKPSPAAAAAADAAQQITSAEESKAKKTNANDSATASTSGDGDGSDPPAAAAITAASSTGNASSDNINTPAPPTQAQAPREKPAQRTPEATVLIKNIPDRTKEPEIRAMFQPYATKLNQKILGITLLASRGFCFVDFDSKAVVDEVVKDVNVEKKDGKSDSKFMINGKKLDVARKVPLDNKGGRGRGFRSASPGNGNFKHRGGRRPSPRGGNRSGAGKK